MRKSFFVMVCAAAVLGVNLLAADKPPDSFVQLMKANGGALQKLGKDVDAKDYDAVAAGAAAIQKNFGEVGKFLTEKKMDAALEFCKTAFKAAGDVLYAAKAEVDARENEEFAGNLEAKLALLTEAEPLLKATDRVVARNTLTNIQRRWDAIGKVPRDQVKVVEERLRRIEQAVKALEEEHWQKNDPEKKARSQGLAAQLHEAIAALEADLERAKAAKDATKVAELEESLEARRAWLAAVDR